MAHYDILIVGAGHGGAQAALALRQHGFSGSIGLIGDEPDPPYERPPLSKEYLKGEKSFERLLIRPASFWGEREVALLTGTRVVALDAAGHTVSTAAGETIGYGSLIWAGGGGARRLACAGAELSGVHTIRTRGDVDRLLGELPAVETAIVIGGGYIGLEAAAVLTTLGKRVVLLEALDRVLARVAGEPLSRFYEAEHRGHGVDIRLGAQVNEIVGSDGRVAGVRLADAELIAGQAAIVGIGIVPEVEPLVAAGAEASNGVHVDGACRTSLPDVFAIGDCAAHANRFAAGARIRLESVQNANDQAKVAVDAILGKPAHYDACPWFWSNQYDLKLQTVGLSTGHDRVVTRGEIASRHFSLIYLRQGQVIALDCVNMVKDYVQGRALVERGAMIEPAALADAAVPLKELAG